MSASLPRPDKHASVSGGGNLGGSKFKYLHDHEDDDGDAQQHHHRVILLLDMDCFYAQCETVRLGLDQSIPLALVQWNSALAVNYPAREFGIKRGDSFQVIQEKSRNKCVGIHLPVMSISSISPSKPAPQTKSKANDIGRGEIDNQHENESKSSSPQKEDQSTMGNDPAKDVECGDNDKDDHINNDDSDFHSSQSAYDIEFNQPQHVRDEMYKKEKNKMRSPKEGKACLDRYRLASSRIFSLIEETLTESLGKKNFILERASIDELFIDVTAFCYLLSRQKGSACKKEVDEGSGEKEESFAAQKFLSDCERDSFQSLKETHIFPIPIVHAGEKESEVGRKLRLGCHAALLVRRAILRQLGFTLSAGISTSKLVAKLAATYGKPNGQAVIYPSSIPQLMEETQLRKARMLGGKLGKKVSSLLPETETTMGSIARLLTLDDLITAIGEESGRWVFDACRGICREEVKPTLKVLPKSLTAFKSFPTVTYPELHKWTTLLVSDVMKRVDLDTKRNNRTPKSATVGYTMTPGGAWIGHTFRLPFPTDKDFDSRVQKLVDGTRKVLTERGHCHIIRIGFSAIDFVNRSKHGIDTFFTSGKNHPSSTKHHLKDKINEVTIETCAKANVINSFFTSGKQNDCLSHDSNTSRIVPAETLNAKQSQCNDNQNRIRSLLTTTYRSSNVLQNADTMTDEKFAKQLQNSFDNEAKGRRKNNLIASHVANSATNTVTETDLSRDETIALQLQLTYDRENRVLSDVERFSGMKKRGNNAGTKPLRNATKKQKSKIDFFLSKPKR